MKESDRERERGGLRVKKREREREREREIGKERERMRHTQKKEWLIAPVSAEQLGNTVCVCLAVCARCVNIMKLLEETERSGWGCTCRSAENVSCVISCNASA